ncbi:MAG: hypothetical protein K8R77_08680 [Anaerolineaceae bacterium]|nr:hypothetical protein [Anaerolineaceae bacterium]
MTVKLIMNWDITPQQEREYFEFVIREFIPGVQRLGFELGDAWATAYGHQPQIMVTAVAPSQDEAEKIIHSTEWAKLTDDLMGFVQNYSCKLIESSRGFQF